MSIISNMQFSSDIISTSETYIAVFLIIILSIMLSIGDTKYKNEWIFNMLIICSSPVILTFIAIVIFRLILVI